MRSLFSLLSVLCLLSLSAFSQSPAPLLAIDFEKGIPSTPELGIYNADFALDDTRAHSGRASLRVTPKDRITAGTQYYDSNARLFFNLDGWLDPSSSYEFSVWVYAGAPGVNVSAFISADDGGGHLAFGTPVTGGWYQLRGAIKAGSLGKWGKNLMLTIRVSRDGGAPCWIDDVLLIPVPGRASPEPAEVLYNGIRLPGEWPPRGLKAESKDPMPVPYLKKPPAVIPIDIGRQLFVDDFLVQKTTLSRVFHSAKQYPGNPVLVPSTEAEMRRVGTQQAVCYLGSGCVFYDPADSLFKMLYTAGWRGGLALATSRDGLEWSRPALNAKGENIMIPPGLDEPGAGHDNCAYIDIAAKNADERHKFLTQRAKGLHTMHVSKDGLSWSRGVPAGYSADYCSFFYNPFRNVWVQSIKRDGSRGRMRHYAESRDFLTRNIYDRAVYWMNADRLDKPDPKIEIDGPGTQLYNMHGIAYESLMLGIFAILLGPSNQVCDAGGFPKTLDLKLGFSRDGFHWDRPEREPFLKATRKEGDWNRGHLDATAGVCLVVGDWLYFPYCGFSGVSPAGLRGQVCGGSVGMAILRRDGFASMEAGANGGSLTTRPVTFSGRHLFVNVDAPAGKLLAQVTGADGKPIAPFTFENCEGVSGDTTIGQMNWKGGADLSALAGKPVRFEFKLTQGKLYAFWVSRDETGRSDGYIAAGGPGHTTTIDTQGKTAYEKAAPLIPSAIKQ